MDGLTEEELQRFRELMERANRELDEYNELSKETRDSLEDFNKKINTTTNNTTRSLNQFGNALTSWVGSVQQGDRGASVAAGALNKTANAAGGFLSTLGPLGKAAGVATRAFGRLALAVAEQTDAQYDAYRGLQQFGAAANDGLIGLQENLVGFGMTVDQLQSMVEMIGQQSVPLAMFKGTVFEARQELSAIGQSMENTNLRENLMRLGMSSAEISEGMVNYVALQSEVGMAQRRDTYQLANATGTYLKEMNALTKATGIQRDAAEEQVRQLRQQERFRAYVDTLRAQGQTELADAAERASLILAELVDPSVAKGLGDILAGGGALSSDDAIKLMMSTGMSQEGAQQIAAEFNAGQMGYEELLQRVITSLGETGDRLREQGSASLGVLGKTGVFVDYASMSKSRVLAEGNLIESIRRSAEEIDNQENETERGVDSLVRLNRAQIKQSQAVSDIIESFTGVNTALATLQEMAAGAADALASVAGAGTTRAEGGASSGMSTEARRQQGANDGSGFQFPSGVSGGGTPGETRGSTRSQSDTQGIEALVEAFSALISGGDKTIADLISTPEGKPGDWAAEIANYMGVSKSQILELSPETVGNLTMGLLGKETDGKVTSGERYKDDIRRYLRAELGDVGEFRDGGIATGPTSGYLAELHGTEAIVPLTGGSIPVTISNLNSQLSDVFYGLGNVISDSTGNEPFSAENISKLSISTAITSLESAISSPMQQLVSQMAATEAAITEQKTTQSSEQVPTETIESSRNRTEQTQALREQIVRLDRLIQVSQSNNNIMSKILQNSYG